MNNQDLLRDSWASLGVAFSNRSTIKYAPEEAILFLITSGEFPEDKKLTEMTLTWLRDHSRLVHVERLQNLIKDCDKKQLAFLGAIASKCLTFGDHRWKKIANMGLKASRSKGFSFPGDEELLVKMRGHDTDFFKFKIVVTPLQAESSKKFLSWDRVTKENPWIRFRLLFGSNLRADVATVIFLQLADTAYAAAKLLKFSTSAVYRNWDDLNQAEWKVISAGLGS
jgi:hypothetical protein